ncbi:hypothetical protein ACFQX7_36920 [Luedemannella flava]
MRHLMEYNATRPGVVQSFTVLSAESVTDAHPAREYFIARYRVAREHHVAGLREELGSASLPGSLQSRPPRCSWP